MTPCPVAPQATSQGGGARRAPGPGTGKSTIAELLRQRATHLDLDTVGIDGFHHPGDYLAAHGLQGVKGAPETFDLVGLTRHLRDSQETVLTWPEYDRVLHDVRPGRRPLAAGLVVVEGNWLLLEEPGWDRLSAYSSFNVFIDAPLDLLRDRLVERKVRGGMDRAAALEFYERSDRPNVERVLTRTDLGKVDLLLHLRHDGTIDPRSTP